MILIPPFNYNFMPCGNIFYFPPLLLRELLELPPLRVPELLGVLLRVDLKLELLRLEERLDLVALLRVPDMTLRKVLRFVVFDLVAEGLEVRVRVLRAVVVVPEVVVFLVGLTFPPSGLVPERPLPVRVPPVGLL